MIPVKIMLVVTDGANGMCRRVREVTSYVRNGIKYRGSRIYNISNRPMPEKLVTTATR